MARLTGPPRQPSAARQKPTLLQGQPDILRNHIPDAGVDLIYLDPPFNSNATYNVFFHEETGQKFAAQITAFEDTWHWSLESESAYQDVVTKAPGKLPDLLQAMRSFLGASDMMAYLAMIA